MYMVGSQHPTFDSSLLAPYALDLVHISHMNMKHPTSTSNRAHKAISKQLFSSNGSQVTCYRFSESPVHKCKRCRSDISTSFMFYFSWKSRHLRGSVIATNILSVPNCSPSWAKFRASVETTFPTCGNLGFECGFRRATTEPPSECDQGTDSRKPRIAGVCRMGREVGIPLAEVTGGGIQPRTAKKTTTARCGRRVISKLCSTHDGQHS